MVKKITIEIKNLEQLKELLDELAEDGFISLEALEQIKNKTAQEEAGLDHPPIWMS